MDTGYLPWTRATDGTILAPATDAGRYCLRCGTGIHATDPEHLCKDIVGRLHEERDAHFAEYARSLVVLGGEA